MKQAGNKKASTKEKKAKTQVGKHARYQEDAKEISSYRENETAREREREREGEREREREAERERERASNRVNQLQAIPMCPAS